MIGANIGIDIGTSSVIVLVEGKGIVLSEPSAVAYDNEGNIVGIGKKAYAMFEKNHSGIKVVRPLENGVVSDFTATKQMVGYFLSKVCKNTVFKPNVIACVPTMVTGLEKRTMLDLMTAAGAGRARLIEEPLAAALGAGIQSEKPKGSMIVDIGAGTADIAVITMGSIAVSKSLRCAGNSLDEAIIRHLRRERVTVVGQKTAEQIKTRIGSTLLRDIELGMTVKGKNYFTGMPLSFEVSSTEAYLAMRPKLEELLEGIRAVLEETPPELAGDVLESGIVLTGGGAKLRNIDKMIQNKTGIKTRVAADPVNCVALGMGEAFEKLDLLTKNGYDFKSDEGIEFSGIKEQSKK